MQWIKARLSLVITGAVAVIAIGLLVWGALDTSVLAELEKDQGFAQQIQSAGVANRRTIEDMRRQITANQELAKKLAEDVNRLSDHQPLLRDVFPAMSSNISQSAPFEFKRLYVEYQDQLLKLMKATDQPTTAEIDAEARRLEAARKSAEDMRSQGISDGRGWGGPGPGPGTITPMPTPGQEQRPEDMTLEQQARERPDTRVAIVKAREGYCYANRNSFDQRPDLLDTSRPTIEAMWYAQVSLWIQEDLFRALADLNQAEAEKLEPGQRWVGYLPFKHLLSTHVKGYVPSAASAATPGGYGGGPVVSSENTASAANAFTQRATTPGSLDVIQLSLNMVIDARKLPAILDAICKAGFYTPLSVNYVAVPPSPVVTGFVYGPAPVINVTIELEGSFLRDEKLTALMPQTVIAAIAAGQPVGAGSGTGGNQMNPGGASPFSGRGYGVPAGPMFPSSPSRGGGS